MEPPRFVGCSLHGQETTRGCAMKYSGLRSIGVFLNVACIMAQAEGHLFPTIFFANVFCR